MEKSWFKQKTEEFTEKRRLKRIKEKNKFQMLGYDKENSDWNEVADKCSKGKEKLQEYNDERNNNRSINNFVKMNIETYVPSKWRFVDLETGDIWRWEKKEERFVKAEDITIIGKEN